MQFIINDLAGLKNLISAETTESNSLEFKAAAAISNAKEITKDVSALANGAGGIIIYGLTEKDNKPDQLDAIKEKKFSREYLDQVIALGIQPPIKFKTEPIPYDGGYIYAVHVEPGETAHMSLEQKRYYRRYNFISVAMEDFEIRDIMNRVKHPKITIHFKIQRQVLSIYLRNDSRIYAKYIRAVVDIPRGYITTDGLEEILKESSGSRIYHTRIIRSNRDFGVLHGGGTEMPLGSYPLSGEIKERLEWIGMMPVNFLPIYWAISADNAEVSEGTTEIQTIPRQDY